MLAALFLAPQTKRLPLRRVDTPRRGTSLASSRPNTLHVQENEIFHATFAPRCKIETQIDIENDG